MKILVELEVENCKECPHYSYKGTSWSEDVYLCSKTNDEVMGDGIPNECPFIKTTLEKLWKSTN